MSNAKELFVEVPVGAAVFSAGEVGGEWYIVESGQIDIVRSDNDAHTLGPGAFLGEAVLLDAQPHTTTARAKTAARLLRIERGAFAGVVAQNAQIALEMLRKVVARERRTEQRLHDALAALTKAKSVPMPTPAPVAPTKAEAAAAPAPAPVVAAPTTAPVATTMALRVVATGEILALDPARSDFLVGRLDPATGVKPEIDLGPFDAVRTLSRRHAKILHAGGLYSVREDTATTNGTFVNGVRLVTATAVEIKPGDRLRFGSIEVELVAA